MRRHRLTDAALTALAAGRPDPATIAELRSAQLGRHRLLLRELTRHHTLPGYATLAALEKSHPPAVRATLADPLFGAWASHRLRTALQAAGPTDSTVADELAGWVDTVRRDVERGSRWLRADHGGLGIRVRVEDADPYRALLGLEPTGRLGDADAAHWQDRFTEAWRLLVTRHRPAAEVLAQVLAAIVPVRPDPDAHGISATSADAFGAVAMSTPANATELAVGLLHETQHSLLNAVHYLFPLHVATPATGYSPWRDDPRPAGGILHGAYAYLAVARFWLAEARANPADRLAAFEHHRWRAAVLAGTAGLTPALTPAGRRFTEALRDEVHSWPASPADPQTSRLAGTANADHHLRWRLRNLTPDPAAITTIAAIRRHSHPTGPGSGPASPSIPIRSTATAQPRRALETGARLTAIHAALRTPPSRPAGTGAAVGGGLGAGPPGQPGGRVTAGDVALVRGDAVTAGAAYLLGVAERPGDDAAWSGLALVSTERALRERVEVVAAVFRALDGVAGDPLALGAWLNRFI